MPLGRLQTAIVDHLRELGKLTDEQTNSIINSPAELTGEALDQILIEEHKVSTEQLLVAKARAFGMAPINGGAGPAESHHF